MRILNACVGPIISVMQTNYNIPFTSIAAVSEDVRLFKWMWDRLPLAYLRTPHLTQDVQQDPGPTSDPRASLNASPCQRSAIPPLNFDAHVPGGTTPRI